MPSFSKSISASFGFNNFNYHGIKIDDVEIHNGDYVMADIDGIVIIPQEKVIDILEKSEKLINTESQVRKAIREGMDPQEAYIKYSVF